MECFSYKTLEGVIKVQEMTVETLIEIKDDYGLELAVIELELLKELQKYRELGTLEVCKEAIEKQKEIQLLPPKKSTFTYKGICPICRNLVLNAERHCS